MATLDIENVLFVCLFYYKELCDILNSNEFYLTEAFVAASFTDAAIKPIVVFATTDNMAIPPCREMGGHSSQNITKYQY